MDKKEYQALLEEAEAVLLDRTNEAIVERIALRDAVCAYLESERSQGVSLDAIRASIERILHRAERVTASRDASESHRSLAQRLIDWCVQPDPPPRLAIVS